MYKKVLGLMLLTPAFILADPDVDLLYWARRGNVDKVTKFLKDGANVNFQGDGGKTALILALEHKKTDVVNLLLQQPGIQVDLNANGLTALSRSSMKGQLESVKLLVSKGANINAKDKDGFTPLMQACFSGESDVALFLISQGADVNAVGSRGSTALSLARSRNAWHYQPLSAVIDALVAKGAK